MKSVLKAKHNMQTGFECSMFHNTSTYQGQ